MDKNKRNIGIKKMTDFSFIFSFQDKELIRRKMTESSGSVRNMSLGKCSLV